MRRLATLLALPAISAAKGGSSGGGGGCFLPQTEVTLADGTRRSLSDLQPGDVVASWDETLRQPANSTVRAVPKYRRAFGDLVEVDLGGSVVHATDDHPFWSQGPLGLASSNPEGTRQLYGLEAELMTEGLQLEDISQAAVLVVGVKRLALATQVRRVLRAEGEVADVKDADDEVEVMTLCLEPHHWYYANGVRVHNKGCVAPWTQVLMVGGKTSPIDELLPGDEVVSWDDEEGKVSTATILSVEVFEDPSKLLNLTFNGNQSLVLTVDHPVYSMQDHGLVSGDPVETWRSYGLEMVGRMNGWELMEDSHGNGVPVQVNDWNGNSTPVMTLQLDRHHWFYAEGLRVHNKGGGSSGYFYGGQGSGNGLVTMIVLSVLGSLFGSCCCCACCYWGWRHLTVTRPWQRRLREMAQKREDTKGSRGPLPEVVQLWGEYRENEQCQKCEYTWCVQPDGALAGTGSDNDGSASVEGKVIWGDDGKGEVRWLETRPGISVEAEGQIEADATHDGPFYVVTAEYWSSNCKTQGTVRLQSYPEAVSCDQVIAEFPEESNMADTTDASIMHKSPPALRGVVSGTPVVSSPNPVIGPSPASTALADAAAAAAQHVASVAPAHARTQQS